MRSIKYIKYMIKYGKILDIPFTKSIYYSVIGLRKPNKEYSNLFYNRLEQLLNKEVSYNLRTGKYYLSDHNILIHVMNYLSIEKVDNRHCSKYLYYDEKLDTNTLKMINNAIFNLSKGVYKGL